VFLSVTTINNINSNNTYLCCTVAEVTATQTHWRSSSRIMREKRECDVIDHTLLVLYLCAMYIQVCWYISTAGTNQNKWEDT
jgi:hypothetical protein